jgi:hypothetical protein
LARKSIARASILILGIFSIPKRNQVMDSSPASKRRRHSKDDEIEASAPLPKQMSPVVIFAHGAGAPSSSDWMLRSHFPFSL